MTRGLSWTSSPLVWLVLVLGCTPGPSAVPLGLGPLAVAERDAASQAAKRREKPARSARPRAAEPAAPLAAASVETPAPADKAEADADEGQSAASAATPLFEGLYAGDDIAVYRLTGLPEREERDDKAKIRIDKASSGNVSITLINSADGSDLCELTARVEGNAALIELAQPCFGDGSEGSPEAELTSGRAVLEGDRLKMDASFALPDQELDGELSYSFKGQRQ